MSTSGCDPDVLEWVTSAYQNRLIEWDIAPEHTPLEAIVRKAMSIENSEEVLRREVKASGATGPPDRKWGRFANRVDGPQPFRPATESGGSESSKGRRERFRANSATPQPSADQSQRQGHRRQGRKLSRAKRDELRAAGKCFQCEDTGHDQRNCPKPHPPPRPTTNPVHVDNVEIARLERLSKADVRVGAMSLSLEGGVRRCHSGHVESV